MWYSLFGISKKLYDKYSFNAARSIVCGATPSLAAIVPRGAERRFGKWSIFCAVFADRSCFFASYRRQESTESLVRHGLRHFGKTQRQNAASRRCRCTFHFTAPCPYHTKEYGCWQANSHILLISPPVRSAVPNDFGTVCLDPRWTSARFCSPSRGAPCCPSRACG